MTDIVPWVKWSFDHWRTDEGLRVCSLAARGLWIELLAVMHKGKPYGYLVVNGNSPTPKQIASLVGMSAEKEITCLLAELESAGVFSRSDNGLIFCRRLVRDNQARTIGRQNGYRGGNPLLKGVSQDVVNGSGYPEGLTPPSYPGGLTPPVKIEKEKEKEREDSDLRSDAEASSAPPSVTPIRDVLWRDGLPILQALTGKSASQSRGLLGKLLKGANDDCARLYAIFREAESLRPVDPVAWLTRAANPTQARIPPGRTAEKQREIDEWNGMLG